MDAFERTIGYALPESYREFLLQHNGGVPTPDVVDVSGLAGSLADVQVLFGLRRDAQTTNLDWNISHLSLRLSQGLIPIACDSFGNVFCLAFDVSGAESICYLDLQAVYGTFDRPVPKHDVAPSFSAFLRGLHDLP